MRLSFVSVFVLAVGCGGDDTAPGPAPTGGTAGSGAAGTGGGAMGGSAGKAGSAGATAGVGGKGGGTTGGGGGIGGTGGGSGAGAGGASGAGTGGASGAGTGGGMEAGAGGSGGGGMAGQTGGSGSAGAAGAEGIPFAYVGGTDGTITIYRFDRAARTLTFSEEIDAGDYPSFLAVDPSRRFLYAVLEGTAEVAAFAIDQTTGSLTPLNQVAAGGNSPAHVSVDKSGRWVMVANYSGGNVRVFPIESDGSLGSPTATPSPGTNPHLIVTDRDNRFAFVPCKGSDLVAQYSFDEDNGTLTPNGTPSVATASGAGPRHLAFSYDGRFAYLINELDDTMTAMQYDAEEGVLTPLATLSTLPMGTSGGSNTTAEVAVHPNGGFVYGSNRGHDSIVVYRVDGLTGTLTLAGHDSSGGETPRHFSIDDTGTVMLVANRNTNNVVVFDIDQTTGRLSEVSEVTGVEEPEFAAIVVLPGP